MKNFVTIPALILLVGLAGCVTSQSGVVNGKNTATKATNWSSGRGMGANLINGPRGRVNPLAPQRTEAQTPYAPENNPYMCSGEECTCGAGE